MPLWNFVQVGLTGDYKWLVIEGIPPNLPDLWDDIYAEYCEITKDTHMTYVLNLTIEIETLDKHLVIVSSVVEYIKQHGRQTGMAIELLQKDFGFNFTYEDLDGDLNRTLSQIKTQIVQLKLKEKEYREYQEGLSNEKASLQDYIEQLAVISKHTGFHLQIHKITVAEWVAAINQFKATNKAENGK